MPNIWEDDNENLDEPIWRYFKVERLIDTLKARQLYFPAADQFEDLFEGSTMVLTKNLISLDERLVKHDLISNAFKDLCRLVKINSWHHAEYESNLMWAYYTQGKKGVAIKTTVEKLLKSLKAFRLHEDYGEEKLYWGEVKYIDLHQTRLKTGMLERFFYKHRVYEGEREFRIAISLRMAEEYGVNVPDKGICVSFDPKILIEKLYLGPNIPDESRKLIINVCSEIEIEDRINVTSLLGHPWYA